jgi:hypothetical protein
MENLVLRLPEHEVLIHIKVNEFSKHLEKEIESLTATFDLEDSTEGQGHRDYHWEFKTWEEAVSAGDNLKNLDENRHLITLKDKSNCSPGLKPISYKA